MNLYYPKQGESQESCAHFSGESSGNAVCENECFATFPACGNQPEALAAEGVAPASANEGLVYGDSHTTVTTYTLQQPIYAAWRSRMGEQKVKSLDTYVKRRQKHVTPTIKKTKAWPRLSADDRERRVLDFAFLSESLAWSLNLTPARQAQLQRSKTPAKIVADAINRACRRTLDRAVPISFALEVTEAGRLHVHGIVTLEFGEWKHFREALKSAGGKVTGSGSGRQTDTRKLLSATGWKNYITKAFADTVAALGTDKIVYQCRLTVAGAREEYEASFAKQKARRRIQGRPVTAKQALLSLTHLPATETSQRAAMSQSEGVPAVDAMQAETSRSINIY